MGDNLCEYELQRLAHIRRNHEMLMRLGLVTADEKPAFSMADSTAKPAAAKRQKVKLPAAPPETLRRSNRTRGEAPQYTHEKIDSFGDDDREVKPPPQQKGRKRPAAEDKSDEDSADDDEACKRAEMLESTVAFLRAAREALAQYVSSGDGEAPASMDGWRSEAVARWGNHAGGGGGTERDWKAYVQSRMSKPPPLSDQDLLQEYYAQDMWQLLCTCVLMTRCSSWATKHRCISGFFEAFPTPSVFLETVVRRNELERAREIMHSLGLFDDRLKGLIGVTQAFLVGDDCFQIDLKEHKVRGIGEFGYHSWLIFTRDQGATLHANDCALKSFCAWRKKNQHL